jgi:hypothetical protein
MTYAEFVVMHVNTSENYGHVRQLSSPDGVVQMQQLSFEFDAVAQIVYDVDGNIRGYCIPHEAIVTRVPQVGDRILGIIARDPSTWKLAVDERGALFLRQWFYAQQPDLFEDVDLSSNPYASFEDDDDVDAFSDPEEPPSDEDDDRWVTDPDDLAEIEHGRAHEMYNS